MKLEQGPLCPDAAVLRQLCSGIDLDTHPADPQVILHIESCERCQKKLEQWASDQRTVVTQLLNLQNTSRTCSQAPSNLPELSGFRIDRELGRGGAAVVYLAEDLTTQRRVALKLIAITGDDKQSLRNQWRDEVRAAARMEHHNIVRLYRVDETSSHFALVFEYVPGGTLRDWRDKAASPVQIVKFIRTIALAIQHIHRGGILHLDLKPSNILIDTSLGNSWDHLVPKVSDFGISSWNRVPNNVDPHHRQPRGTLAYMAPEQLLGEPSLLSPATDVYGLGGVLFTLLTGESPYRGLSDTQITQKLLNSDVPTSNEALAKAPQGLRKITSRCLEKHPQDRFQSMQELADALQNWHDPSTRTGTSPSGLPFGLRTFLFAIPTVTIVILASIWLVSPSLPTKNATVELPDQRKINEWADEITQEVATFDVERATRLIDSTRRLNQHVLSQNPISFEHCLQYGKLQLQAAEGFTASLNGELHPFADTLLTECIGLLFQATELRPNDQLAINELIAARYTKCWLSEISEFSDESIRDPDHNQHPWISGSITIDTVPYLLRLENRRQQIHWMSQFQDLLRSASWHFRWRSDPAKSHLIEQFEAQLWNELGDARQCRDLAVRHALTASQVTTAGWPKLPIEGWVLSDSRSDLMRETILCYLAEQLWSFTAQSTNPEDAVGRNDLSASDCGDMVLRSTLDFMETQQFDKQLLPSILHIELIRPVARISTELRRESRLSTAQQWQFGFLSLANACQREYPDDINVTLSLSEAHLQAWKNAIRQDDDVAAIAALEASLAAAEAALVLAPDSLRARFQVADRIRRLTRFQTQ